MITQAISDSTPLARLKLCASRMDAYGLRALQTDLNAADR